MEQRPEAPFATTRAPKAMVCSIDHLASSAGVAIMRSGGNAVDAAIAANAVLSVTSQHMCGMGGDLFALVHTPESSAPTALNASGRSGSGADPDRARADGLAEIPMYDDIRSTPVPGCVDGWLALNERHGKLPLATVLEPAIEYAEEGFPASPSLIARLDRIAHHPWAADYTARSPRSGDLIRRPGVARTLRRIATEGRDGFYLGEFGDGLLEIGNGEYTSADLEASQADWVDPLVVRAWDHDIWTIPPNSQGYLNLASAWIAAGLDLPTDPEDPLWVHYLAETSKQVGFDRTDSLYEHADGQALVSPERLAPRLSQISPDVAASLPHPVAPGGTMYMCAVDADRMGVSLIQSNAGGWGSGIAEPSTRIFLQNRGLGFNLTPGHPAEYGPRRRPPHTLAPALVTSGGALRTVLGTMGGDSQPQVVAQLLARLLHSQQSPGTAIAAPRYRLFGEVPSGFHTWSDPSTLAVQIEGHSPSGWEAGLAERGHRVRILSRHDSAFGHAHMIDVTPEGLAGAADPRALVGAAVGF